MREMLIGLAFAAGAGAAEAATVEVRASGLKDADGRVLFSLCPEEGYGEWSTCALGVVDAAEGEVSYLFEEVAPGVYGVNVIHDRNRNGKLDLRWWGPPAESYGASNDPKPRIGPPRFDDIKFTVGDNDMVVVVTMIGG